MRRGEVREALREAQIVFLDPPRKGSDEVTLGAVAESGVAEHLVPFVRSGDARPGFEVSCSQRIPARRRPAVRHVSADRAHRDAGHALPRVGDAAADHRDGVQRRAGAGVARRRRIRSENKPGVSRLCHPIRIDIRYVAKLARIALTDEEVERFGAQLSNLLEHVNVLSKLDTASVSGTAQVVESRNVEREDVVGECLDRETVLSMAPQRQGAFFRVPRIIAEEG